MNVARMVYLHALTPVHSGTGQAAEVIDLPIAREKATGYPVIPASSFKGVKRDSVKRDEKTDKETNEIFGSPDQAGALCFTDQRILCLPVRSYYGTFAYVTCHLVLSRLVRDATAMGVALPFPADVKQLPVVKDTADSMSIGVTTNSPLKSTSGGSQNSVYLEDLDLIVVAEVEANVNTIAQGLAGVLFAEDTAAFTSRFAVVSDQTFSFLCETATEVAARIVLNEETKIVGNLWYEEAVPAETLFCGPVLVEDRYKTRADEFFVKLGAAAFVQIGGNASVGRGLCRVVVAKQ